MAKKTIRGEKEEDELIEAASVYNYDYELEEQEKEEPEEAKEAAPNNPLKTDAKALKTDAKKKSTGKLKKAILTILGLIVLFVVLVGAYKLVMPFFDYDPIIAIVDGTSITQSELVTKYALIPSYFRPMVTKEVLLNQSIIETLLYNDAKSNGYSAADNEVEEYYNQVINQSGFSVPEFEAQLSALNLSKDNLVKIYEQRLVIGKFLNDTVVSTTIVSEKEISDFYKSHSKEFVIAEQAKASHILVGTKEEADNILNRIKAGESFENLAVELSQDKNSGVNGGDLGYFAREDMVKEFSDAAFSLDIGEISSPVKTEYGYHLIKAAGRKEAREMAFSEVADSIKETLSSQKQQDTLNLYISSLMKDADIIIVEPAFKAEEEVKEPVIAEEIAEEITEPIVPEAVEKAEEEPVIEEETKVEEASCDSFKGVVYYYANWCSACTSLKSFIDSKSAEHNIMLVEESDNALLKKCFDVKPGFPQLICVQSKETIKGSMTEGQTAEFLEKCGQ